MGVPGVTSRRGPRRCCRVGVKVPQAQGDRSLRPSGCGAHDQGGKREQPDVDLPWRTGNERRTSNFLPWHTVYAEPHFTPGLWPWRR
ncbi:undecaprenyl diphosphate synthase family protein [Streptomyces violarus]|uniref:undecaprenyl diphosphate synthase family protein n=1 Tax=Streptomyces TaxID=1883 RepID=UPI002D79975F|nr:undecaprenyl diphosphate synthase family protein [Streptomyces sp. CGMCC 4.1772]WRT97728.1 undecaprenyl diphosphate synthase family protein [Streptomyces sp. CGMCC 4.1772]